MENVGGEEWNQWGNLLLTSMFFSLSIRSLLKHRTRTCANTPEASAFVNSLHALKRLAQPEEIAKSALYLASDLSSFTTGTALLADGGVSINRT